LLNDKDMIKISDENFEIGEHASKKGMYNSAVSRYYYSNFQRVMLFHNKKFGNEEIKTFAQPESVSSENENSGSSHSEMIKAVVEIMCGMNKFTAGQKVGELFSMRRIRNDADYGRKLIKGPEAEMYGSSAKRINELIDSVLGE